MNLQETIYHEGHLIGDVTFQTLMLNHCDGYDDNFSHYGTCCYSHILVSQVHDTD